MDDKTFRKFARFCSQLSIVLGTLLAVYLVVGVFIFGLSVSRWFLLIFGIALLSYIPKLHLGVIDEEKKHPQFIDGFGKQGCFVFFFGGCVLIISFFLL
jgi:hypothetical protein